MHVFLLIRTPLQRISCWENPWIVDRGWGIVFGDLAASVTNSELYSKLLQLNTLRVSRLATIH